MSDAWIGVLCLAAAGATTACLFHHYVIRVERARRWLARGARLIDVDAAPVFSRQHPRDAVSLPLDELELCAGVEGSESDAIIVYAHSWRRGARAVRRLHHQGFRRVMNMAGLHTLDKLNNPE